MELYLVASFITCSACFASLVGWHLGSRTKFIVVFITALAAGSRIDVGKDYDNYSRIFVSGEHTRASELIFSYIVKLISYSPEAELLGFLLTSFVTCFAYSYFFNKLLPNRFFYAWALFLAVPVLYLNSLNLLRQHLAISLALVVVAKTYENKSIFIFLLGIALTALIHHIAIIMWALVAAYLVNVRRHKDLLKLCLPIIIVLLIILEESLIEGTKYQYFFNWKADNSIAVAMIYILVNLYLLFTPWRISLYANNRDEISLVWLSSYFSCTLLFVWLLSEAANFWLRLSVIFAAPFVIGLILSVENLSHKCSRLAKILLPIAASSLSSFYWLRDPSFGHV